MSDAKTAPAQHKPRPLIDLLVSILLPSIILMKLSGDDNLDATNALLLALAFPVGWGLFELVQYRKFNFIALLGVISVLLTGGIGVLQLDTRWLAIKEAAVPGVIGLAVLGATSNRWSMRRLGKRWKPLHKFAYVILGLVLLHFFWVCQSLPSKYHSICPFCQTMEKT